MANPWDVAKSYVNVKTVKTSAVKTINIKMKTEYGEIECKIPVENYNKIKSVLEDKTVSDYRKISILEWAKTPGTKLMRNPVEDYKKIMRSTNLFEKEDLLETIANLSSKIKEKENIEYVMQPAMYAGGYISTGVCGGLGTTAAGALGFAGSSGALLGAAIPAFLLTGLGINLLNKKDFTTTQIDKDLLRCARLYRELMYKLDPQANPKNNPKAKLIMLPDFAVFLNYALSQK